MSASQRSGETPHTNFDAVWKPRRASVEGSVAQYSKFVSIMKIALPAAAGLLLLLVILLPLIREQQDRFRIGAASDKDAKSDSLSMTNARYYGTDDKGQPYSVTAQSVRQVSPNDRTIELTLPKAEITLSNGTWLSASANNGVFDRDNQVINLTGDVALYQYQGNELHTSEANIQLKDGTANGRQPVTGSGPFGTLEAAGGFDFSNDQKKVHFLGRSKLVINTDKGKDKDGAKDASAAPAGSGK